MIGTHLKTTIPQLKTKLMIYRSFKNININTFNRDLSNCLNDLTFLTVDDAFEQLIAHISNFLDKHAPLKQKKCLW